MVNTVSKEVQALIEELDLVPCGSDTDCKSYSLTVRDIVDSLEDLGYDCSIGDGYVTIDRDGDKYLVNCGQLPFISVSIGYDVADLEDKLESLGLASEDINRVWNLVKAIITPEGDTVLVVLDALHLDVSSFQQNIQYYLSQLSGASKALWDNYKVYESERMFRNLSKTKRQRRAS